MKIILISPQNNDAQIALGDNLADALDTFHSRQWQCPGGNQTVLEEFGDYLVYAECWDDALRLRGTYAELLAEHCPQHLRGVKP